MNGPATAANTPRNLFGAPRRDRFLGGTRDGPDGKPVPNITPHDEGIGEWSNTDVTFALKTSILPDGDVFGGAMAEVVGTRPATGRTTTARPSPSISLPSRRSRTSRTADQKKQAHVERLVALQHGGRPAQPERVISQPQKGCDCGVQPI